MINSYALALHNASYALCRTTNEKGNEGSERETEKGKEEGNGYGNGKGKEVRKGSG